MQISFNWIKELVNLEMIKLNDLIEKLTLGGFEVEETFEIQVGNQKQIVLDISATANRSDSLSIYGISKEISALLNQPIEISNYLRQSNQFQGWEQKIQKKAEFLPQDSNCTMFLTLIIENLQNFTVPEWIKQKLLSSGIGPANNLSDFQSYILLETGYPFEFYDYDAISARVKTCHFSLSIKKSNKNQKFLAKNDCTYLLDNSILTLTANEIPISIAGFIEGKEFEVSKKTTKLLIEGTIFDGAKIRQQSRKLGLRTDRSARYEKSLGDTYFFEAIYRLIHLLRISNPELKCKLDKIQKIQSQTRPTIKLRYDKVNEILGPIIPTNTTQPDYISPKMINNYLDRLKFDFSFTQSQNIWSVKIPDFRAEDITREIDLIEEIGRLHGFNNFVTAIPKLKTIGTEDSHSRIRKKISVCLLNLGFNEMIHYSLVNKNRGVWNDVELINPLLAEYSALRSTLLPNLLKTVQTNLKQKNLPVEGFEYGHVFSFDPKMKFKEKEYVSGIFGGIKTKVSWTDSAVLLTWFEAKGKMEQFFEQLNISIYWQESSQLETKGFLHPYRSAEISSKSGLLLGIFGQIHPIVAKNFNLSPNLFLFEFDLQRINSQLQASLVRFYQPYSLYPKVTKNLSLIVPNKIKFEEIKSLLYCNGTQCLSQINLLDEYRGERIPKDCTSLCLELIFQSDQKTLENKTIERILEKLQLLVTQEFNATLRD
jgi:phenylalanyl-tRNA synthetase beta chain